MCAFCTHSFQQIWILKLILFLIFHVWLKSVYHTQVPDASNLANSQVKYSLEQCSGKLASCFYIPIFHNNMLVLSGIRWFKVMPLC